MAFSALTSIGPNEIVRVRLSAFCGRRRCDRFLRRVRRARARESRGRESLLGRGMRPARYRSIFSISFGKPSRRPARHIVAV